MMKSGELVHEEFINDMCFRAFHTGHMYQILLSLEKNK